MRSPLGPFLRLFEAEKLRDLDLERARDSDQHVQGRIAHRPLDESDELRTEVGSLGQPFLGQPP